MKEVEFSTMLNIDPASGGLGDDFFNKFSSRNHNQHKTIRLNINTQVEKRFSNLCPRLEQIISTIIW